MAVQFTKYQGLGNDFILIDNRHQSEPIITPDQAVKICDRHFGIGADGVIFAFPGQDNTDYSMRIFNSDGSEPEMCGNGIRCFAKFINTLEGASAKESYRIHTLAGVITPKLESNGEVTVDMGKPILESGKIPTKLGNPQDKVINYPLHVMSKTWNVTCVSMGNPHCVTFVKNVDEISLETIGKDFEHHTAFPQRINTEFIEVVRPDYLKMRVWERGAGITLACGTGACASVVAGVLAHKSDRSATVLLPGGELRINWSEEDDHVYMTGTAELVFMGSFE